MKNRMYRENRKSINIMVGCKFDCVYCKPSFQRNMKRQKQRCLKCYEYTPHFHPKRLLKAPPRTQGKEFVFFPSSGDPSFLTAHQLILCNIYMKQYPETTFLIQTKNPESFNRIKFPNNAILGITLETDRRLYHTPSIFKTYRRISKAPIPIFRHIEFKDITHKRKAITIEPILQFNKRILTAWIYRIEPEFVYIGYDNHNCKLPEPTLKETKELIKEIKLFTEVRIKTLRKAWYE